MDHALSKEKQNEFVRILVQTSSRDNTPLLIQKSTASGNGSMSGRVSDTIKTTFDRSGIVSAEHIRSRRRRIVPGLTYLIGIVTVFAFPFLLPIAITSISSFNFSDGIQRPNIKDLIRGMKLAQERSHNDRYSGWRFEYILKLFWRRTRTEASFRSDVESVNESDNAKSVLIQNEDLWISQNGTKLRKP